jgi:hypothetical protein
LRQPALDTPRWNGDHFGGERIGRRPAEDVGERINQRVRPLGAVNVQTAHPALPRPISGQ